jgi:NADH-quinone oxidoreductase subunit B
LIALQEKIDQQSILTAPWYRKGTPADLVPIPVLGPDLVDLRQLDVIRREAGTVQETTLAELGEENQS